MRVTASGHPYGMLPTWLSSFAYVQTIPNVYNATTPAVTFWGGTPELERLPATHPELGWLTSEVVAAGIAPIA